MKPIVMKLETVTDVKECHGYDRSYSLKNPINNTKPYEVIII